MKILRLTVQTDNYRNFKRNSLTAAVRLILLRGKSEAKYGLKMKLNLLTSMKVSEI